MFTESMGGLHNEVLLLQVFDKGNMGDKTVSQL